MFRILGRIVSGWWPVVLVGWAVVVLGLWYAAPSWAQISKSGQFAYLPADAPSRQAEEMFDQAFPGQRASSGIVLVVTRVDGITLRPSDRVFITNTLTPQLRETLLPGGNPDPDSPVLRVRAPGDVPTGVLLRSPDQKAELVVVELHSEFLDSQNWPTVAAVEHLIEDLRRRGETPTGLDLALTGSAVLGRDTGQAEARSAGAVQRWTIIVVVVLLLLVYRSLVLAILLLLTVFVAIEVALRLLGLLSEAVHLNLYQGTQLYVTVVGYGAGVDYCLFLIARSKEEWETGARARVGVCEAIARVGPAVTASAATVVVGIAMMGFADFGKIRQAGLGIAFSLAVVLVAALTLAPALLCLTGRFARWPETAEQAALHLMIRWRTRVPEASSPPHPEPHLVG
jgi:RND superfamily putative drug exporter